MHLKGEIYETTDYTARCSRYITHLDVLNRLHIYMFSSSTQQHIIGLGLWAPMQYSTAYNTAEFSNLVDTERQRHDQLIKDNNAGLLIQGRHGPMDSSDSWAGSGVPV